MVRLLLLLRPSGDGVAQDRYATSRLRGRLLLGGFQLPIISILRETGLEIGYGADHDFAAAVHFIYCKPVELRGFDG
jgi:hypothetical protein